MDTIPFDWNTFKWPTIFCLATLVFPSTFGLCCHTKEEKRWLAKPKNYEKFSPRLTNEQLRQWLELVPRKANLWTEWGRGGAKRWVIKDGGGSTKGRPFGNNFKHGKIAFLVHGRRYFISSCWSWDTLYIDKLTVINCEAEDSRS